ncbi:DNA polymerase sliding clamp [Thermoplasma volcanium]|uniref:DNA polymerase sliding clamp n=1 Tax=Thermoplasma volcanium (strain ATCC 51530 / DSM 4299 / JCM 9571 / NBRC 15438 / GSS1) TaxID=273116 RepID=PCNA_THEVO|nr:DNA polymerase sliding clamp [Thermoplasma volcanium]Q979S2.2 RecName: Full=DNA polymerase sliding clamp; AltName: Full=Proliferating cell nuclear antigen homolog; Short=PCNA [Thermoplasma volcanium GSS1]
MIRMNISVRNLKEITDLLSTIVSEAKFKVDENGMSVTAVDPAHVAMIRLEVPKEVFSEFRSDGTEEIALDIDRLKSVIRLANSSENVGITKDKEKLKFDLGNISKSVSLLDPSTIVTPKIPNIASEYYAIIKRSDFERGLRAAEDISDSIRFVLSSEGFRATSHSESEESEMVLPKDMLSDLSCSDTIKSSYPLEYLLKFIKAVSSADSLKISFRDDYPLSIEFYLDQNPSAKIKGLFLLAPRMEQ